jgi:hypothetical protein
LLFAHLCIINLFQPGRFFAFNDVERLDDCEDEPEQREKVDAMLFRELSDEVLELLPLIE